MNCPNCGGLWEPFIGCMEEGCGTEAELDIDEETE